MYKIYKIHKRAKLALGLLVTVSLIATYMFVSEAVLITNNDTQDQKVVYLTFDDGPSKVTEQILDILKEHDIKGTFFVVGSESNQSKKIYKRIQDEGHSIGLHSYSHDYKKIYSSLENYKKDLEKLENLMYDTLGFAPKILRFPGGSNNITANKNVMKEIINYVQQREYKFFDWNIIAKDDKDEATPAQTIFKNVTNHKKKKAVILFHDDIIRTSLKDALPKIINYYKENGYLFETLVEETTAIQFNKG